MHDRMNEMFECRERVKAVLLTYEIDPIEQADLVTDLAPSHELATFRD
jgi:hypothetical protein